MLKTRANEDYFVVDKELDVKQILKLAGEQVNTSAAVLDMFLDVTTGDIYLLYMEIG